MLRVDSDPNLVAQPHPLATSLEPVFAMVEIRFNELGSKVGVSLLTGSLRIAFGGVQAIIGFAIAFFTFLSGVTLMIVCGRKVAASHFEEASLGIRYTVHGLANMVRGLLEMAHISACANPDPANHPLKYMHERRKPSEDAPLLPDTQKALLDTEDL